MAVGTLGWRWAEGAHSEEGLSRGEERPSERTCLVLARLGLEVTRTPRRWVKRSLCMFLVDLVTKEHLWAS